MSASARKLKPTEYQGSQSSVDDSRVMFTGENREMRISEADDDSNTTYVSLWRIIFSPAGPGSVLYFKSELTDNRWRIFSDNAEMTRWLQRTVQGMLKAELKDTTIPVAGAAFSRSGDPRDSLHEKVESDGLRIEMTWSELGEPILLHSRPNDPVNPRPYGVCAVIFPAMAARVSVDGKPAKGRAWPRERMGRPYSTCLVGFSESWTEPR
jgi:hypothetical protein